MSTSTPAIPAEARIARARLSLEGLSVGDAFGEQFFVPNELHLGRQYFDPEDWARELIRRRSADFPPPWPYTDDTQMALSLVEVLARFGHVEQDALARSFGEHFEPGRDYGGAAYGLLLGYRHGRSWRQDAPAMFDGQGSFGNGAAMRVAPLGAYFADDLARARYEAWRSAEVTHAHPEGIAGAVAVAIAAALATRYQQEPPAPSVFLDEVIAWVPSGEVRRQLLQVQHLAPSVPPQEVAARVGSGYETSAQDTVPFCLWCAATRLRSYEQALWATVAGLGDRDTTCAIVGGIVVMSTGLDDIPAPWRQCREPLAEWASADR